MSRVTEPKKLAILSNACNFYPSLLTNKISLRGGLLYCQPLTVGQYFWKSYSFVMLSHANWKKVSVDSLSLKENLALSYDLWMLLLYRLAF